MLLAAHGAYKPLAASDPFWADVRFMQTFDGIADGTVLSNPIPSLKTGVSYTSSGAGNYTVTSTQGRFLKSAQNTIGSWCSISNTISGNFTFETSGFYTTGSPVFLYASSTGSPVVNFRELSGNLFIQCLEGGTSFTGDALIPNTWYDAAVSWDGTSLRCFWNGVLLHTSTKSFDMASFRLPNSSTANAVFADEIRLTAACRYTASYTPSHPFPAA
jgi:hypothetical protein